MAKRDGWGQAETARNRPLIADGPSHFAVGMVLVAGLAATLTMAGWLTVGDFAGFEGPKAGWLMIGLGTVLGGVSGLILPFVLSRQAAGDGGLVRRLRLLSEGLVVVAVSPALYLGMLIGTVFNYGNN